MKNPIIGRSDIDEARSRVKLLEACDGLEITFFRDKFPALDGLIHIVEAESVSHGMLTNVLVTFQLKSKRKQRKGTDTSTQLKISDLKWMKTLPIPAILLVVDLRTNCMYMEWLAPVEDKKRRKPNKRIKEPCRLFAPTCKFSLTKFKQQALQKSTEMQERKTTTGQPQI